MAWGSEWKSGTACCGVAVDTVLNLHLVFSFALSRLGRSLLIRKLRLQLVQIDSDLYANARRPIGHCERSPTEGS